MIEGRVGPFKIKINISRVGRSTNNIEVSTKDLYKLKLKSNRGILSSSII